MIGHKICFYGEIRKIIFELSLLPLLIWSAEFAGNDRCFFCFDCYLSAFVCSVVSLYRGFKRSSGEL